MERPTRMMGQPLTDLGMLVGGVVVDNAMDELTGRNGCLDGIEEADEFLVSMLLHATADDLASNTFKAANNVVVLFLM
jgi:hypothetical protein